MADIMKHLIKDLRKVNMQARKLKKAVAKTLEKKVLIADHILNNRAAEKYQEKWTQKQADAFLCLLETQYKDNPFVKASRLCPNGTMLFLSNKEIIYTDVQQLLVILVGLGRYIHVNTGTHGMEDGSTIFWTSDRAVKWLKEKKQNYQKWIDGTQQFVNEDLEIISKTCNAIQEEQRISARFVSSDVYPIYPEYCDVVNAWCYSETTPRCPQKLLQAFKFHLDKNDLHDQWENNKDHLIKKLTRIALEVNQTLKTDNIYVLIRDCLKILGIPPIGLVFLTDYVNKCWKKNYNQTVQVDKLPIDDNKWNENLIKSIIEFCIDFLVHVYQGKAQEFINQHSEIKYQIGDKFCTYQQQKIQSKRPKPERKLIPQCSNENQQMFSQEEQQEIFNQTSRKDPNIQTDSEIIEEYKQNLMQQLQDMKINYPEYETQYENLMKNQGKVIKNQRKKKQQAYLLQQQKFANNMNKSQKLFERQIQLQIKEDNKEEKLSRLENKKRMIHIDETKDLILEVVRSDQRLQSLRVGDKIVITQEQYFGRKEGNEWYQQMLGDHGVYLGREHQPLDIQPFIVIVGKGDDKNPKAPEWRFSRYHIRIAFDKECYWIQDLKTTNPICIILSHEHPMKLTQGMMIKTGIAENAYLKISTISTEDGKFYQQTKKGDDLHQFFTWKNSKVEYGEYKRQNFLKILDEFNEKVGECYPNDQNDRVWHLVSKGCNVQDYGLRQEDCLFINNIQNPGYWADIYHEKGIGWYIQATKIGEQSQLSLKVVLKDVDQLYNDGGTPSSQVLIQENMHFSIGITHDYVFKATTRIRPNNQSHLNNSNMMYHDQNNYEIQQ